MITTLSIPEIYRVKLPKLDASKECYCDGCQYNPETIVKRWSLQASSVAHGAWNWYEYQT